MRSILGPLLVIPGLLAACDHAPTDPNVDVEALISANNPGAAAGIKPLTSTLPALFRESIAKIEGRDGHLGVEALLSDWRKLQNDLKDQAPSLNRSAIQAKVQAIHNEEVRVVLQTLGSPVLTRVMSDVNVGLAETETQISLARMAGANLSNVAPVLDQVREKAAAARGLISAGENQRALDLAAQAATLLSGVEYYLVESQRITGVEGLFPLAVAKLNADPNLSANAREALKQAQLAESVARATLRSGERSATHARLAQARAQQINVVLQAFGSDAATHLISQIDARLTIMRATIDSLETAGTDVVRYERMLREATDLATRARDAARKGDSATALDLGSHAAGMLNALQHLTWK